MAKVRSDETFITKTGEVLDSKAIDELAEEAERGYDLSKAERILVVGRPSLGDSGASPRLSFRAPPDLFDAARLRAEREGRSISDLAREALTRFLDS